MTDAAIEWWGKAGDQALRRSAFQEAIAHLGKAIEMADKEGKAKPRAAGAVPTTTSPDQRLKLQTSYGRAMIWSKGFSAPETAAAFAGAQELIAATDDADERFTAYSGILLNGLARGEFVLARETAETFRRDAENAGRLTETAVALRYLGLSCYFHGDLVEAHDHLIGALSIYDPERDREARFRFGLDTGVNAMALLAPVKWELGDLSEARAQIEQTMVRANDSAYSWTGSSPISGKRY